MKMSNPIKNIKEKFSELLVPEPSKKRILKTALEGFDAIKTNEIKNLEGKEMEIVMLNGKIKFEKLRNEWIRSKTKCKVEILEGGEKQARKNIKNIEKLKSKLREMETMGTKFISYILVELIKTIYTRCIRKSKIKSLLIWLLIKNITLF